MGAAYGGRDRTKLTKHIDTTSGWDNPPKMLLSVITAVLDAPEHLRATRECLKEAGCAAEHVIVDGGSAAPTQAILRDATCNGARVISEIDEGIYQAVNKGLKVARGRYI